MADHDEILRRQREKMEEHRRWLAQQQSALRDINAATSPQQYDKPIPTHVSPLAVSHAAAAAPQQNLSPYQTGATTPNRVHRSVRSAPSQEQEDYLVIPRTPGSPLNVHARSTQWARRKEQRLEELKAFRESENEQHCPFSPGVHDIRYNNKKEVRVHGYEGYMERQKHARELKQNKVLKLKCDGSKWTGEVTVPEEFQLGVRNSSGTISSLKQPIKPPSSKMPQELHHLLHDPTVPTSFDAGAGVIPPKGMFSVRTSSGIIDAATRSV